MYSFRKVELNEEESIEIENLLILLSSVVPANVYLGIQLGQNYITTLDKFFICGFEEFCRIYPNIVNKEFEDEDADSGKLVNMCYSTYSRHMEIVVI